MAQSKLDRLIAAAKLIDAADLEIAFARGQQARAHNRPRTGVLVPKLPSLQLDPWEAGWDAAEAALAE